MGATYVVIDLGATIRRPDALESASRESVQSDWYVVQVKPRQEARVVRHLALSAVITFLPYVEVSRRRASRKAKYLEPLFPGYVFTRLAATDRAPASWNVVRWAPGVLRILAIGSIPVPVPEDMMQAIERQTSEHGFVRLPSPLVSGAKVRVRSGPFEDLEAVFDRPMSRSGRVR
ncbi:MAG: transcription termination/antitermination protein NusG, partial [Acidimicrobiia bacterium]